MKQVIILVLTMFSMDSIFVLAQSERAQNKVVTTLFPTYDFVKQIGKDNVNVSLLLPPGVESHSFEPKPQDIVEINKADIFIYTGEYMEPWVEDMLKGITNKHLLVVDASQGIELMADADYDEEEELHEKSGGHHEENGEEHEEEGRHHKEEHEHGHHHHGGIDPHIWLDLGNAQIIVDTIARALADKDPSNNALYFNNAKEYNMNLADLDRRFKETLSTAKNKTIIYAGHFAFGYFARRYGLKHISPYEGFSPNAEPSPKAIAGLITKLKESSMKYVYYEELLDPKVARTIAQETGAKLELLHGAHNVSKDELKRGVTFLDIMEDNLKKLKLGLECR